MTGGEIAMFCLGASTLAVTAINLIWTNVIARRTDKIDALEHEIKTSTVAAINERMGTIDRLNAERFTQIWQRFEAGERRMESLEQKDHKIELTIERRLADLQADMRVIKSRLGVAEDNR